jgi:hypothetical protein
MGDVLGGGVSTRASPSDEEVLKNVWHDEFAASKPWAQYGYI